ncbi:molybdopterin biosynthesis protein [Haloglomus irregulare]|jgi:molybdenum cofactor synthesis domain-containing protein|uniref:Molybdopterin biosynthesis protein n=1 Tax=Haloglomus irregulare TaxID=2234134 RepID=A0A554ND00_9EURY|nr:molybdopterin biosynthesis protein [Haloglomus irregulare]TSD15205.1 molybdopterin biosynthesis protein [Haloglomus irregulare]
MSERKEFRDLATPAEATAAIEDLDLTPDPETVPLREARGRVLGARIDAAIDVPGFDRASVDGYAVRAADTVGADEADPVELDLVGEVHAGEAPDVTVPAGGCAEISTGAVLPEGADAVVMVERTDSVSGGDAASDRTVRVRTSLAPGDRVMFAGADVAAGERALGPGTELGPREIGLLAALGVDEVPVRGRPVVGIVSTGEELVRPGGDLDSGAGQIYDVNSYTTATAVEAAGGEARLYPHAGDDYDAMERVLREAATECDLVLSSGSTSASAVDVIYRVIEERGELLLHGVAVKPGKPMLVGRLVGSERGSDASSDEGSESDGGCAYVGLPGYPVSALTIFRTFVAPAIRDAAGLPEARTATMEGTMAVAERYAEGRLRYMPAGLVTDGGGRTLVYPVDKGSGATTSLVEADGVVAVDPDVEYLDAGESVTVQLFSPDVRPPTLFGVGEDDPLLSTLLDRVARGPRPASGERGDPRATVSTTHRPRYLGVGSREGLRRLRDDVPDVAVTSAPGPVEVDHEPVGAWTREWGLVVPAGNPEGVDGLADLADRDLRFVNRTTASGLRTSLGNAVADLAAERGVDRHDVVDAIDGFDAGTRAHESPARRVLAGRADAGLGLRATAADLDAGFVPVGEETVHVLANPDRVEKPGVNALERAIAEADAAIAELPGYGRP